MYTPVNPNFTINQSRTNGPINAHLTIVYGYAQV